MCQKGRSFFDMSMSIGVKRDVPYLTYFFNTIAARNYSNINYFVSLRSDQPLHTATVTGIALTVDSKTEQSGVRLEELTYKKFKNGSSDHKGLQNNLYYYNF